MKRSRVRMFAALACAATLPFAALAGLAYAPPVSREAQTVLREYIEPARPLFRVARSGDGEIHYLARNPERFNMAAFSERKGNSAVRIFVLGGSVGGNFRRWWGEGGSWAKVLSRLAGGRPFEVINVATGGYDSLRELWAAREALGHRPDLLVVFTGNNEGTHLPSSLAHPRLSYAAAQLDAWRWFRAVRLGRTSAAPSVRTARETDLETETNLRALAREARAAGVPVVFCAPPLNLLMPPSGVPAINMKRWRWGREVLAGGDRARGGAALRTVVDLDATPGRSTPGRNALIRRVAREEGATFADLEKAFAQIAPGGVELYYDNMHWRFEYNPYAAAVISRALCGVWPRETPLPCREVDAWLARTRRPKVTAQMEARHARAGREYVQSLRDEVRGGELQDMWLARERSLAVSGGGRSPEPSLEALKSAFAADPDVLLSAPEFEGLIKTCGREGGPGCAETFDVLASSLEREGRKAAALMIRSETARRR